jgi:hypothetical protein
MEMILKIVKKIIILLNVVVFDSKANQIYKINI